jgi:UDP-GlcNAc:undecaprenyl-phosphate/decaprenyl-phosphate GlcNAc-1-phosphate transferase
LYHRELAQPSSRGVAALAMNAGLAFSVGAFACFVCSALALRIRWCVSLPARDRWHRSATPLTGGLALLIAFLLGISSAVVVGEGDRRLGYLAMAGAGAFLLGLGDDARLIGPRTKFAGQLLIACATVSVIRPTWLPAAAAVPVGVFVLVAAMNSFNFLDNMDGLAAGTAAVASGTLALTAWIAGESVVALAACAVAGTAVGFLPFNYRKGRPAALFMGDSGAHLLGLLVGSCALLAGPRGAGGVSASVLAPLLILALPILDTSLVIVVRLAERRPIWRGGRDHLSHRLVFVGLGERQAVAALLLLATLCGAAGLAVAAIHDALVTGAAAGAVVALLVGIGSRLAFVHEPRSVSTLAERPQAARVEPVTTHAHAS